MINRHRRHAAPVVDAGVDQLSQITMAICTQIRRRLDIHCGAEYLARGGYGPQQFFMRGMGHARHSCSGLGTKVLNDDFLYVAVPLMQITYRDQRIDALLPCLANADEDAGGERDAQLARQPQYFQTRRRMFIRRAEVRPAFFAQTRRCALQHHALRCADFTQFHHLVARQYAGIHMRQ